MLNVALLAATLMTGILITGAAHAAESINLEVDVESEDKADKKQWQLHTNVLAEFGQTKVLGGTQTGGDTRNVTVTATKVADNQVQLAISVMENDEVKSNSNIIVDIGQSAEVENKGDGARITIKVKTKLPDTKD